MPGIDLADQQLEPCEKLVVPLRGVGRGGIINALRSFLVAGVPSCKRYERQIVSILFKFFVGCRVVFVIFCAVRKCNMLGDIGAKGGVLVPTDSGFTLIELLLVIAIIGVMSALIISSVINAASDSRDVIGRQQQVVLQEALNSWIMANSSGTNTIASAQALYTTSARTMLDQMSNYLHSSTYSNFSDVTGGLTTDALSRQGKYLSFLTWSTTSPPTVNMNP